MEYIEGYYVDWICPRCGVHTLYLEIQRSKARFRLRCDRRLLACCPWRGPWANTVKEAFTAAKVELEAAKIAHAL